MISVSYKGYIRSLGSFSKVSTYTNIMWNGCTWRLCFQCHGRYSAL